MPRLLPFIAVLSLSFFPGCGVQVQGPTVRPTRPDTEESDSTSTVDETNPAPQSTPVELIESTWNDLQSLIAEHKGKIVVVDVWSTACEPCMKEFPHLIELQKLYPDKITAISFDVDFAGLPKKPVEFYKERVTTFLGSQAQNNVLHRMCTTAVDDLLTEINLNSIPAVYVYNQTGELAKRFDGTNEKSEELSYEKHVFPFVEKLIQ